MTRINKIHCNGFKSFAKHTEFIFDGKFNCIIGPNGSGKSNVLDALCFVLGKSSAKSLRAEKASNLIYNGGKLKNPAKSGEVSIFFDNVDKVFPTPEKEVKITRIVQQNGQSKYKINDQTRTRQQILDLLYMAKIDPDGYNIILQGDIVHFVEMPPMQRRELIDEISGIATYEEKKRKSLLELQKVDAKLEEADIILRERNNYLKELKKDRDQAIKYKDMSDSIQFNKASYIQLRIDKRTKIKQDFESKVNERKEKIDKITTAVNLLKAENEQKKEQIEVLAREVEEKGHGGEESINKELETLKIEQSKKASRIDLLKNEITKLIQRNQELAHSDKDLREKVANFEKKKAELNESKTREEKQKTELEDKIDKFKKKHKLDSAGEIEKGLEELDFKIEEQQKSILELRESQQNLLREQDRVEYQINTVDERVAKMADVEKEHKMQLDELKVMRTQFKEATLDLNKRLNEDATFAAKIADLRKIQMNTVEELAKLEAKNITIREATSQNVALHKIKEEKKRIPGIFGTIAELGKVEPTYAVALEQAAGPRINSIIVENDKVAAQCIKFLKDNKFGTATFLPLNKIKHREVQDDLSTLEKSKGVKGQAIDLIDFDKRYKNAFSYVFDNTLVIDHIETARAIGIGKVKMVTLDGDTAETSGAMHGGFRTKKKGGVFLEKDIQEQIEKLETSLNNLKNDIDEYDKVRAVNEDMIHKLREKKATLEGEIIKTEKSLHLNEDDLSADKKQKNDLVEEQKLLEKKIREVQNSIGSINIVLTKLKGEKQALRDKISLLRSPTLIAELNTFEQKRTELGESLIHLSNDIKNIENEVKNIHNPELEKIQKIIKQHEHENKQFSEEIKKREVESEEIRQKIIEKEKVAEKFYKQFKELFSKRGKINEEISAHEKHISTKQDEAREIEIKMNTISLELARTNAELTTLNEEFEKYRGLKLELDKTEEEYKAEIAKFERMMTTIGSVNMRALDIYEQVEKEYEKLIEKKNILEGEKNTVVNMINEIEGKKKDIFMAALQKVNSEFQAIFNQLSTKGEADLELENPENPFEGGLNIKVKIAANKFMDIKGLSGGEKTMTALAFIFAIQEHDPASFYVLDEVDAALDKRNAEKLAELVAKYSDRAQYIMISHNDQVISKADNLYGVSMNEHGMSKVVSLKI